MKESGEKAGWGLSSAAIRNPSLYTESLAGRFLFAVGCPVRISIRQHTPPNKSSSRGCSPPVYNCCVPQFLVDLYDSVHGISVVAMAGSRRGRSVNDFACSNMRANIGYYRGHLAACERPLQPAMGQETAETILIGFHGATGEPELIRAQMVQVASPLSMDLMMLKNDEIQRELEIVPSQRIAIFELQSKYVEVRDGFRNEFRAARGLADRQSLQAEYSKQMEELQEDFREMLLPHQIERLGQVMHRLVLEQEGMLRLCEKVAGNESLVLKPDEKAAIREAMNLAEKEFCSKATEEYRQFISDVAKELPEYNGFLDTLREKASLVSADVLFVDLKRLDELADRVIGDDELRERLSSRRWLRLDEVGNWEEHPLQKSDASSGLFSLTLNLGADSGGIITEPQLVTIREMAEVNGGRQRQIILEQQNVRALQGEKAASEYFKDEMNKLDAEYFDLLWKDVLLPAQRDWLIEVLRQREAASHGVAGILFLKPSPVERDTDPVAKDKVKEIISKKGTELQDKLRALFEESIDKQINQLPDSIKSATTRSLGEKPNVMVPNLTLTLDRTKSDANNPKQVP